MKPAVATQATLSDKEQGIFYMHFPTDRTGHTSVFDGPVVNHWLQWKIAQIANASAMQDRSTMKEDPLQLSVLPPELRPILSLAPILIAKSRSSLVDVTSVPIDGTRTVSVIIGDGSTILTAFFLDKRFTHATVKSNFI